MMLSQLTKKSKGGLIQGISSNFDTQLCTQNHLQQTYALASIIGQPSRDDDKMKREDIQRLKKQQLYKIQLSDIEIKTFADEKKPKPNNASIIRKVWSLSLQSFVPQNHHTEKSKPREFFIPLFRMGGDGGG